MNKYMSNTIVMGIIFIATFYLSMFAYAESSTKKPVKSNPKKQTKSESLTKSTTATSIQAMSQATTKQKSLPRLVDLGAKKCIPCKMMIPVLEELSKEYKDKLEVTFIDVWENPDSGKEYKIRVIPTQIFYDNTGKEFFRHEGYFPKEDILAKFKENKIDLSK